MANNLYKPGHGNVSITKVGKPANPNSKQGKEIAEAREAAIEGKLLAETEIGTAQNPDPLIEYEKRQAEIAKQYIDVPKCSDTKICPAGFNCIGGYCVEKLGQGEYYSPGSCGLPPTPTSFSCNDGSGNCVSTSQGNCSTGEGGSNGPNCCGETYTAWVVSDVEGDPSEIGSTWTETLVQQCEPFPTECVRYADEYYKLFDDIPTGYSAEDICNSCQECSTSGVCEDISEPFADCYCYSGVCEKKEGPCFSCDTTTGDCIEDCKDCVLNQDYFFKCPCDVRETDYKAQCHINPCTNYSTGPGGTCWQMIADDVKSFCEKEHPCDEDDSCIDSCNTVVQVGSAPSCPPGKHCRNASVITNESTGQSEYLLSVCDLKEDCGCDADPSSDQWVPCGNCQICQDGRCVRDPGCPELFTEPGRYDISYHRKAETAWPCLFCNGFWTGNDECDSAQWNATLAGQDFDAESYLVTDEYETDSSLGTLIGESEAGIYTDGIFHGEINASVTIGFSCGEGEGGTWVVIGQATYQRLINVADPYYGCNRILYKAMATFTTDIRQFVAIDGSNYDKGYAKRQWSDSSVQKIGSNTRPPICATESDVYALGGTIQIIEDYRTPADLNSSNTNQGSDYAPPDDNPAPDPDYGDIGS